ncbi:MAG: type II toxin-antitoxin system VapC family toxin [Candidatus Rokubacteria bacterium]|nr:type II toxin-antitoxin system VapC family toxin [Candidatus Rokubacteria bacterium]
MRFWDSSAVVPLLVEQDASDRVAGWVDTDHAVVLWTLTSVEVASALRRLVRERALREALALEAEARMDEMARACHVVVDIDTVKTVARRLLRLHTLRAFDALQLAAAMQWAEGHPDGRILCTLDGRLAEAARREGFVVPA